MQRAEGLDAPSGTEGGGALSWSRNAAKWSLVKRSIHHWRYFSFYFIRMIEHPSYSLKFSLLFFLHFSIVTMKFVPLFSVFLLHCASRTFPLLCNTHAGVPVSSVQIWFRDPSVSFSVVGGTLKKE
jgi:hypothetical protein